MTSYRGIDKDDLLKSIAAAKNFIVGLHLGPATEEWFSTWAGSFPYAEIRSARSSEELVSVLKNTGVREAFQPFQDVFAYHGMAQLADDAEDAEDDAPQLYADLAAWGAFSNTPTQRPLLETLRKELDAYLIIEGFRLVAEDLKMRARRGHGSDPNPVDDLVRDYLAGLRKHKANKPLAAWLETVIPVFTLLKEADNSARENEASIKDFLEHSPLNGRVFLKDILSKMTGLSGWRMNVMDVPRPIMLYGVEPEELLSVVAPMDEVMGSLRKKVFEVLQPYARLDEASLKKEGVVDSRAQGRPTVFFNATARAAQHVANHVADAKVLRYEGLEPQEIKPNSHIPQRLLPPPSGMS